MKQKIQQEKASPIIFVIVIVSILSIVSSGLITYILLEMKFKDPIEVTISDWIKVIVPVLGSALIVIFAFLGVDRLKDYDMRQDRMKKELKEEFSERTRDALIVMEPKFEKKINDETQKYIAKLHTLEEKMNELDNQISQYEELMGSISDLRTVAESIGNIEEAHLYIGKQFDENILEDTLKWRERTATIHALVHRVSEGELKGNSDDYHNMAAELARKGYYDLACEVIDKGIKYFPYNVDLLSDALQYVHTFENAHEIAQRSIDTLDYIGRMGWNWRAFCFYIQYINELDPTEENHKKVMDLIHDFKKQLPDDERAYMAEYETFLKYGEKDKAEAALVEAEKKLDMTAQCSLKLSEIYRRKGKYDEAIDSATKAIKSQAETQPNSVTGAAFAFRGFARDAKIFDNLINKKAIEEENVKKAIGDFVNALKYGFRYENVTIRINILSDFLSSNLDENNEELFSNIE